MELLTIEEFAERMRISVPTARHWRAQNYGPRGVRIGRKVMYRTADVEAFLSDVFAA